ncbi:MAG: hypothetical protein MSG64_01525 [Pyrinomonadaceae bacterium MAG19_C2-C3]|nr:hypothetical protein [Pyrinomonadaceae bacterium MAG19_C2-C3]
MKEVKTNDEFDEVNETGESVDDFLQAAEDNTGKSVFEFGIESDKIEVVNESKAAGAQE